MKRRGFSLAEALITLLLLGLLLSGLSQLLTGARCVKTFSADRNRRLTLLVRGLPRLRADLEQASAVSLPTPGGTSSTLSFTRPQLEPERLTFPVNSGGGPFVLGLTPVSYRASNGSLMRSGGATSEVAAEGVTAFQCRSLTARHFRLLLRWVSNEANAETELTTEVYLMGGS